MTKRHGGTITADDVAATSPPMIGAADDRDGSIGCRPAAGPTFGLPPRAAAAQEAIVDSPDSPDVSNPQSVGVWAVMGSDPNAVQPARWYHLQDGDERYGPISLAAIRKLVAERIVTGQTLVWSDGMPDWTQARDVPALIPPEPLRQHVGWPTGSGGVERSTTW